MLVYFQLVRVPAIPARHLYLPPVYCAFVPDSCPPPNPYSLIPNPYSLIPIPYSLIPIPYFFVILSGSLNIQERKPERPLQTAI